MKRAPVDSVTEHPYPTCEGEPLPEGEVIASGTLRAGPISREQSIVEHYEFRRRGCVNVATVRQEWSRQISDVEVIYDLAWRPIRAWKRMTVPGVPQPDGLADIRLYELRNSPATMTRRSHDQETLELRQFNPGVPGEVVAAIGPGRALVSAWIWAQDAREQGGLEVGETVRGPTLDFREFVEVIDEVALRRDADREEPTMGRTVRVYTIFGRESIFTDENGIVQGDLSGLRTPGDVEAPMPPPLDEYLVPDPEHTPR